MIHILTMIFYFASGPVVINQEYRSLEACEAAIDMHRNNLKDGKVVLADCTKK